MKVTLVDHMGTDLTVVNAARVSFNKTSEFVVDEWTNNLSLNTKDTKLISYLAKHNHWSPFAHCQVQFHFKAPIFVARQLAKSQVGMVWNEVSRRYVDEEPEFYMPKDYRLKEQKKKQGSSDKVTSNNEYFQEYAVRHAEFCKQMYTQLIGDDVCPEIARIFLPINTYTEWYWTGSLVAWARVFNLRTKPDAQKETQEIVRQIDPIMTELFPVSWKGLTGEKA